VLHVETGQADSILTLRDRIAAACELGLEEIVSKRGGSRYWSGASRSWLKAKNPAFERA
jgi:ATP-dependent DNA ligase